MVVVAKRVVGGWERTSSTDRNYRFCRKGKGRKLWRRGGGRGRDIARRIKSDILALLEMWDGSWD